LPPGFEIQLLAAEPDLRKPMNMAFFLPTAEGRMAFSTLLLSMSTSPLPSAA